MAEFLNGLLSKVAEKVKWKNWKISDDVNFENGNGFLGEFFLTSIINEDSGEKLELAVKKAFTYESRRQELCISNAFKNEIHFYENIIPALLKFMDERKVKGDVEFFTRFFGSCLEEPNECLVMENLRIQGYGIVDIEQLLGQEYVEFVFENYGRFHALSFALKDQKPEEYRVLKDGLFDFMEFLSKSDGFQRTIYNCNKSAFECMEKDVQEDCEQYVSNSKKLFGEATRYKGDYKCIVHGDCWTNNMMFKYKESKLKNIKLIDFQLSRESTPVHDLSYFLYSGANKESYGNIDKFLRIYHESFSKMCKDLGSDPNKVYPFEALKEDWRKYSKWGIMWGIMHNKMKLVKKEDIQGMMGENFYDQFAAMEVDENKLTLYRQRIRDLVGDVYEKGFLIN